MNNTLSVLQNSTNTNDSIKNITINNLFSNTTNISNILINNTNYILNNDTNSTQDYRNRSSYRIGSLIICSLIICLIICVICSPLTQRICYSCCICFDKCFLYIDNCFYKIKNIFRNNNSVSENYSNRNNVETNIDIEKCIENKNFNIFFTKIENENENNKDYNIICSICIEPLKEDVISLNCKHKYHKGCIKEWLTINNLCPLCRNEIY